MMHRKISLWKSEGKVLLAKMAKEVLQLEKLRSMSCILIVRLRSIEMLMICLMRIWDMFGMLRNTRGVVGWIPGYMLKVMEHGVLVLLYQSLAKHLSLLTLL